MVELEKEGLTDSVIYLREYMVNQKGVNSWINREGVQSITHVYSLPDLDKKTISAILKKLKFEFSYLETESIQGFYAEHGLESFLIYQPRYFKSTNSLAPQLFNQSIDSELSIQISNWGSTSGFGLFSGVNFETFKALLVTYMFALGHKNNIDVNQVQEIKCANSFQLIVDYFKRISANKPIDKGSHLGNFSIIYNIELKVIGEIFKKKRSVSIHDVATNTAHFPLLINALSSSERFGINYDRISCSDIDLEVSKSSAENICKYCNIDSKNISFKHLDLLSLPEKSIDEDVLVANDILEHFDENNSRKVLNNLWKNTRLLLVVHVPFEEIPREEYGHFTAFNKEKLASWASDLPGCLNLTEQYLYILDNHDLSNKVFDHFLFLAKEEYLNL